MQTQQIATANGTYDNSERYANCVRISKRIRWDIEDDVIRGRTFDPSDTFLPAGLTLVDRMETLSPAERRTMSQIQGRTYANIFGLVERFIGAKVLEMSSRHWLGDQTALEALVRFSDEELKHQELFRRIERMTADCMPLGYEFPVDPNAVARAVLSKSTWAILALTCHIELFTQAHYKESIAPEARISPLYKDVFLYHWREEAQHAVLDELEWRAEDLHLTAEERSAAVSDFIDLVGAVDGILQEQAKRDTAYFVSVCGRTVGADETRTIGDEVLRAYRWQYIVSGARNPRFIEILSGMVSDADMDRVVDALAPLMVGLD